MRVPNISAWFNDDLVHLEQPFRSYSDSASTKMAGLWKKVEFDSQKTFASVS